MRCSYGVSANAAATGANLINWGRAPTTLTTFTGGSLRRYGRNERLHRTGSAPPRPDGPPDTAMRYFEAWSCDYGKC
ncbi:hypothetical protein GCM10010123_29670 [Pilimelia anulata]|uniref:Uncharacterized protein n=1 Tax=Pilimelia anulata TaxID=53371 RepID=A0A8J3BAW8_9ACTN|nr:hypothetical protein GCM10010123_29670 [Pilimelia anulata]